MPVPEGLGQRLVIHRRYCQIEPSRSAGPRTPETPGHDVPRHHMVGVTGFTLNPALRSYLLDRSHTTSCGELPTQRFSSTPAPHRYRLRDRLSRQELSTIIESFNAGTPAHVLSNRYGVGETALKALLRQHGVRRRPVKLQQDQTPSRQISAEAELLSLRQRSKRGNTRPERSPEVDGLSSTLP